MNERRRISITTRITLFTGVVAALLCALMATVLMVAIHRFATASLTEEIVADGGRIAIQVERGRVDYPLARRQSRRLQIVDTKGQVIASTQILQGKPPMATFTPGDKSLATSIVCGGVFPARECNIVAAQRAHRRTGNGSSTAPPRDPSVDRSVAGRRDRRGRAAARRGHHLPRPPDLHRLSQAGERHPGGTRRDQLDLLGRRVPVPSSDDEIHDLAESVNHTLGRLRGAVEQQRQFASDASHDLRSPIAAMRAEVEDALQAPRETSVTEVGHAILGSLSGFRRSCTTC